MEAALDHKDPCRRSHEAGKPVLAGLNFCQTRPRTSSIPVSACPCLSRGFAGSAGATRVGEATPFLHISR